MSDTTIHICEDGPHTELRREPAGIKWCFRCRQHLPHDWIVTGSVEPSWYEPHSRFDCSRCHRDHTIGFGMERTADE